jgi:hypothetical protein
MIAEAWAPERFLLVIDCGLIGAPCCEQQEILAEHFLKNASSVRSVQLGDLAFARESAGRRPPFAAAQAFGKF